MRSCSWTSANLASQIFRDLLRLLALINLGTYHQPSSLRHLFIPLRSIDATLDPLGNLSLGSPLRWSMPKICCSTWHQIYNHPSLEACGTLDSALCQDMDPLTWPCCLSRSPQNSLRSMSSIYARCEPLVAPVESWTLCGSGEDSLQDAQLLKFPSCEDLWTQ